MGDDEKRKAKEKKGFARLASQALLHTPNLVVAGGAAVGAAALHSLPIAALGGVTYLALVAWDMVSPDFWRKKNAPAPSASPLPKAADIKHPRLRIALDDVMKSRAKLERVLKETPDSVRVHLTSVMVIASELEMRAATLLLRGDDLEATVSGLDPTAVKQELSRLSSEEREATDPGARDQYRQARLAREEQRRGIADLEGARDRAHANLARIVAVLESLSVKVARMRAMDAAAMDSFTGDLGKELDDVNVELRTFEESLANLNVR